MWSKRLEEVPMMDHPRPPSDPIRTVDWSGSSRPSLSVVEAVAAERDAEPMTLEPLHDAVDPDALDAFLADAGSAAEPANASVQFEYLGVRVVLESNGLGYLHATDRPVTVNVC